MPYRLEAFSSVGLDEALLKLVIDEHTSARVPRLANLWTYFRNPLEPVGVGDGLRTRPAQHRGLPARLLETGGLGVDDRSRTPREIVIENDIGWRVETMSRSASCSRGGCGEEARAVDSTCCPRRRAFDAGGRCV